MEIKYVGIFKQQILDHTFSNDYFVTQHAITAYTTAYEIDDDRVKLVGLNQVSVAHLLKTHNLIDLKADPKYSVQYYQDQLNYHQKVLDQTIKQKKTTYFKQHPIPMAWLVDNDLYFVALPALFSIMIAFMLLSGSLMAGVVWQLIVGKPWMPSLLASIVTSLISLGFLWQLHLHRKVAHRKRQFTRSIQPLIDQYLQQGWLKS